jgi:aminoglycoside phosphotransferase
VPAGFHDDWTIPPVPPGLEERVSAGATRLLGVAACEVTPVGRGWGGGLQGVACYRVVSDQGAFFAKVAVEVPVPAPIDAQLRRELTQTGTAHALGLAPRAHGYDPQEGVLVTDFVDGSEPRKALARQMPLLGRLTAPLRTLHESDVGPWAQGAPFDQHGKVTHWLDRIRDGGKMPMRQIDRLARLAARMDARLSTHSYTLRPCHNDYYQVNIMLGRDGKVWVVDWSEAGLGDPCADLAYFAGNLDLSIARMPDLLQAYADGEATTAQLERLQLRLTFSHLEQYLKFRFFGGDSPEAQYQLQHLHDDLEVIMPHLF